ncbi:hypothetical protein EHYA_08550 [Embleya hyalina]|uniref:Uncharacterized protein n=1 Tax=Embleya hyalina TaxID=516124 RepID=A0A401Z1W6_9ACTN|nr:hypothetical protein EHYA_08550 [Embleya hyalina]
MRGADARERLTDVTPIQPTRRRRRRDRTRTIAATPGLVSIRPRGAASAGPEPLRRLHGGLHPILDNPDGTRTLLTSVDRDLFDD